VDRLSPEGNAPPDLWLEATLPSGSEATAPAAQLGPLLVSLVCQEMDVLMA
jgi:hypothetical protein